jgi:hypothetical protein
MFPFENKAYNRERFQAYVKTLAWHGWRPSKIVWHNTAAPSMRQWIEKADEDFKANRVPGISRMKSLENFYQNNQGWNGGPHLFVAPGTSAYEPLIWVANPLTAKGTHSPSFNTTSIGIEMVADFDKESDESGPGLQVKNLTIFATAILCDALGLDPFRSILLHKEDPKTDHDCPGVNIAKDKDKMISEVMSLMDGGDHDEKATSAVISGKPIEAPKEWTGETIVKDLNFREGPGVSTRSKGSMPKGTRLTILGSAKNVNDVWLKARTPAGYIGWVSGRYIKEIDNA